MKKLSGSGIFMPDGRIHKNKVIILDNYGRIESVLESSTIGMDDVEFYNGLIVPGFINTHCHLELSHMKGRVDTGTGLLPFITSVVRTRGEGASADQIHDAIVAAEDEMYRTGIVAVGDISNQTDTFSVKHSGRLRYYTFIECFDFMIGENARTVFGQYREVFDKLDPGPGSMKSLVPHAPYSVSALLYELIRAANPQDCTISIHNQETPSENELFENKTGGFIDFYKSFNISLEHFQPTGEPSVYSALPHLNPENRNLFVHNTLTTKRDIEACHGFSEKVYWATCPNANLYIENRLPDYRIFIESGARMTIGTDSLTSNWQLNILDEMKAISRYQSYVPLETMITWATKNGAEALGFDDELGTIAHGKKPGLVLIEGIENGKLTGNATSRRII